MKDQDVVPTGDCDGSGSGEQQLGSVRYKYSTFPGNVWQMSGRIFSPGLQSTVIQIW